MDRDDKEDKPGVITFPPLIGLADFALGLLLDYLAPMGFVTVPALFITGRVRRVASRPWRRNGGKGARDVHRRWH